MELDLDTSCRWSDLVKFASESGFEVFKDDYILLPLGRTAGFEYGVFLTGGYRYAQKFPEEKIYPYILELENKKLSSGHSIMCYTPEMVIRTAEIGDKDYIIDKEKKSGEEFSMSKALILAYKFRELGTIDHSFIKPVCEWVFHNLPRNVTEELVVDKLEELEEKLEEVLALESSLPPDEAGMIKEDIYEEIWIYLRTAKDAGIKDFKTTAKLLYAFAVVEAKKTKLPRVRLGPLLPRDHFRPPKSGKKG